MANDILLPSPVCQRGCASSNPLSTCSLRYPCVGEGCLPSAYRTQNSRPLLFLPRLLADRKMPARDWTGGVLLSRPMIFISAQWWRLLVFYRQTLMWFTRRLPTVLLQKVAGVIGCLGNFDFVHVICIFILGRSSICSAIDLALRVRRAGSNVWIKMWNV